MNRSEPWNRVVFLAICLAVGAVVAPACAGGPPPGGGVSEETGQVSLPLITSVGGHTYRLSSVFIIVYGPQYAYIFSNGDPNETALNVSLQTGSYTASLQSWRLERADASGAFWPVQASLASDGAVNFAVFNGATSTISYEFRTDGVIVKVGSGSLKVKADVDEIAAACTPFGSDCPEGAWCPPTGLTGMNRACINAGPVALGQPCVSPLDCGANASCIDLGDGAPRCAELCPAASFDTPCTSAGICQAADDDYGVCRP